MEHETDHNAQNHLSWVYLGKDLIKAPIPGELCALTRSNKRERLAELHGLPVCQIPVHKSGKDYSAYINEKPKPSPKDLEGFARRREERRAAELHAEDKRAAGVRRNNKRFAKENIKLSVKLNGRKNQKQGIFDLPAVDLSSLTIRENRKPRREYLWARWKQINVFGYDEYLMLYRACNSAEYRNDLIAAANRAEDLLTKSPDGHLLASALRTIKEFRRVLAMPDGETLLAGILTCVDLSYRKGDRAKDGSYLGNGRSQEYKLGVFVPHLLSLQRQFKVKNPTHHRSVEEFNKCTEKWAEAKGRPVTSIGHFAYACINSRFYNLFTNSKTAQVIERLRSLGLTVSDTVTKIDLNIALPSLMNRLAREISGELYLERPSVEQLLAARLRTAEEFNISFELAKAVHAASHNGSSVGIESACWEGYDIDLDTKLAIARSEEIKQNQRYFKENFKILDEAGLFDGLCNREGMNDSSLYASLYNLEEYKVMKPLHDYLASQGIIFVCKHDGVDIFGTLTAYQIERIDEMFTVPYSITPVQIGEVGEEGLNVSEHEGRDEYSKGSTTQYDVNTYYPERYDWAAKTINRAHAPP